VLNAFLSNVAALPTKAEAIGTDSRGRSYWYFIHDARRLYVQAPTSPMRGRAGSSSGAESSSPALRRSDSLQPGEWTWAYYDTFASVRDVCASLDDGSDGGKLRTALKEKLPLFRSYMDSDRAVNQDEGVRRGSSLTISGPFRVLTISGPFRVLTISGPFRVLTISGPFRVLTISGPTHIVWQVGGTRATSGLASR
jgi:hypothetical protein